MGPVEVRAGEHPLPLAGPRQRTLLALLLLNANRVVSVDRIVDAIWGETPPATATTQVQAQISALRRRLAGGDRSGERIVTHPPGYLIRVEPGELDVDVFEQRAAQARRALAEGRAEEAAAGFRAALGLCRGAALNDAAGTLAETEAARLEERRLAVLEERVEADLAVGRHAEVVSELTALAAEHPLRERVRGQLMVALYRAGRQADALEVYRATQQTLVEELGLDPGPELQRLQRAILDADPSLQPMPTAAPTTVSPPAQLPADTADFTGRAQQLAAVRDQLAAVEGDDGRSRAVVVAAVAGTAGVGKTTLAVHAAHRLRADFPDGQLYSDMGGAGPHPLDAGEVLARFLRDLGVDGAGIPDSLEERAALYRSRLAERRVLVLLDNAASEAQVRPLLPAGAYCGVLVTSRTRLAGLEGARLLELDVLEPDQAMDLLARVAGPERVAAEPVAAERVARLCGHLPLAVRVAAARLAARPHWRLARLAELLADERRRLDELRLGDLEVRANLTLSYDGLDPTARLAFHRLGLLDVPDFPAWVAAALLDVSLPEAEQAVERLVDAQLLQATGCPAAGRDRYRFHDLPRVYARERSRDEDCPAGRTAALTRALGGWLALGERANESLLGRSHWVAHGGAPRWPPDPAATAELLADPLTWLEAERTALVGAVEQAAAAGVAELAWDLAGSLAFFFELRGHLGDWRTTHDAALAAARRAGDRRGEAVMLYGLSRLHTIQDRYDDARDCLDRARAAFRETGERHGEAHVWCGFGLVHRGLGRQQEALRCFEHAVTAFRRLGDRAGEAYALHGIGVAHLGRGRSADAQGYLDQALETFREARYRHGEAQTLGWLGFLHQTQGRLDEAEAYFRQTLAISGELGERHGATYALERIGKIHADRGRGLEANPLLERCLQAFRDIGDRSGVARTLFDLGELHRAEDRLGEAVANLEDSLRLSQELELPLWQAKTLRRLSEIHDAAGNEEAARASRDEATVLFRRAGERENDQLANQLDW